MSLSLTLKNPERLEPIVRDELEQLVAKIRTWANWDFSVGESSGAWIAADATNGFRVLYGNTTKMSIDASGNASFSGAITTPYLTSDANGARISSAASWGTAGALYFSSTYNGTGDQYGVYTDFRPAPNVKSVSLRCHAGSVPAAANVTANASLDALGNPDGTVGPKVASVVASSADDYANVTQTAGDMSIALSQLGAVKAATFTFGSIATVAGGFATTPVAVSAGDTTPSVAGSNVFTVANGSPTTITNFDDGTAGQMIVLKFADANTTVDRTNSYLAGGANFVSSAYATLVLVSIGGKWYELMRSSNS